MPLDPTLLSLLMLTTSGIPTPGAKKEFDAYAEGVVNGLKLGTATVITTGVQGSPGTGMFLGGINPGPAVMVPLIQAAAVGSLPPIPGGTPQPLQILFFLALAQIATHVLTNLQVDTLPADAVAVGIGTIAPGGFVVEAAVIEGLIVAAFAKQGLIPTPSRLGLAKAVGTATQQLMLLTTMPAIPIIGGVPIPPPAGPIPAVGTRTGTIS